MTKLFSVDLLSKFASSNVFYDITKSPFLYFRIFSHELYFKLFDSVWGSGTLDQMLTMKAKENVTATYFESAWSFARQTDFFLDQNIIGVRHLWVVGVVMEEPSIFVLTQWIVFAA